MIGPSVRVETVRDDSPSKQQCWSVAGSMLVLVDVVVLDDDAVSKVAVVPSDDDGHCLAAV